MNSWMLEYEYDAEALQREDLNLLDEIKSQFDTCLGRCEILFQKKEGGELTALISSTAYKIFLNANGKGLFTIDIHDLTAELAISEANIKNLKRGIERLGFRNQVGNPGIRILPPYKRGRGFSKYDMHNETVVEKDHDKVLFSDESPHQLVRIMFSPMFGNVLYLDNDINHASKEPAYFDAILNSDHENYTGKRVLILGGGNGVLLQELRHKGVEHVTMIELDQMVCDVSKVYLRDLCHDSLDAPKGDNYDIIADDCVNPLKRWVEEGRKFDYVFNDIITVPIIAEDTEDYWMFMKSVSKLSMMVLNVGGIYKESQGSVIYSSLIKKYEEQMQDLGCEVEMSKEQFHIPLFHELWNFYTFKKLSNVK